MSFILDALKKSESERQRQSGPALFEVKVAPPRHRFAIWAIGLGALLAINLIVVVWLLSRGSSTRSAAPPQAAAVQRPPAAAQAPPQAPAQAPARASAQAPAQALAQTPAPAPTQTVARTPAPAPTQTPAQTPRQAPSPVASSSAPAGAAAIQTARSPPDSSASANPEDLVPAVEPPKGSSAPDSGGSDVRATESGLPTYQDAAAVPGANLPSLELEFHAYSANPDQRFVFLNKTTLHEGDSLPQGVHVDAITPDGVILSYHGTRFVLRQ